MPIQLPDLPALAQIKPRLVSWRVDLTPVLGGPMQRINRLGSRFAIDVQMPSLDADCARTWLAARMLAEATNDTLRVNFPEAESVAFGAGVAVDGAGQAGTSLAVRGLAPEFVVPAAAFFSFDYLGRRFLHQTTSAVAASDQGEAVLTIGPMLRQSPADGAALYAAPTAMEGYATGTTLDWELQLKRWTSFSFTLQEIE